jgi:aryl-alcohol dehydrogenase-like predicted oxidoreductase
MQRRDLLKSASGAAGLAAWAALSGAAQTAELGGTPAGTRQGDVPYRTFGRTRERVSAIGLGGYHIGDLKTEQESIRLIRTAIDRGITFMDNCWDYHEGRSEDWMGKALQDGYRDKVFLMSKFDGRSREVAARQIDESLRRLRTDRLDLMQVHEVIRMEDPDRIFNDGVIDAMQEARKAGKIRYLGFTGHKDPIVHNRMLDIAAEHGFRFDAVQMPLNVFDAHFRSFQHQVLPRLVAEGIAALGMKPLGGGEILRSKAVSAPECLRYALSLPATVVITGCDSMDILEQALAVARDFKPMDGGEVAALLARTAAPAAKGRFELFKTSARFDGTASNPHWLG